MGYKLQIRLVTTKEGLKVLQNTKQFLNDDYLPSLLKKSNIHKTFGDVVYLGWDNATLTKTRLIEGAMLELEDNDILYTLSTIGENLEDLAESKYNSQNGKIKELPYPSTIFAFDEQDMEEQLKYYENVENKKQLEDYEYE